MKEQSRPSYDVVVIGSGLAGLTLSRQLMLYTNKTVLLLDRRVNPPQDAPQKYGESLVQCSGYYLSRVLDLQEYLLINHYLKYNLRFYWPTPGLKNAAFEDYSQSYSRKLSNVETYQLDRNLLEEHLLETNTSNQRCDFVGGIRDLKVELADGNADHQVRWNGGRVSARWVVDASGRGSVMAKQLGLRQPNPIRHGAIFFWVEGLVDIERLTGKTHKERLYDRARQKTGQFPFFLATNHFCADGQWFWVIPLHHKTSLGLVYEHASVNGDEVATPEKAIEYVCRKWPLFARDLPKRKILDHGRLVDFSHGCKQTISPRRWALVGEAGRFSDPLYSPGSDLIGIYNTQIVDAVQTEDPGALAQKCELAETIEHVMYEAYVPGYAESYNCLGDQEAFNLKYSWELAVYFGFYVLPMINGFYANPDFMLPFLQRFQILGKINHNLQRTLSAFFRWKRTQPPRVWPEPQFFEFYDMQPLNEAETLFYEAGLTPAEGIAVIEKHLARLQHFARYILAHIHASVIGDPEALTNGPFVSSLDIENTHFDPEAMEAAFAAHKGSGERYRWNLNPRILAHYIAPRERAAAAAQPMKGM